MSDLGTGAQEWLGPGRCWLGQAKPDWSKPWSVPICLQGVKDLVPGQAGPKEELPLHLMPSASSTQSTAVTAAGARSATIIRTLSPQPSLHSCLPGERRGIAILIVDIFWPEILFLGISAFTPTIT